MELNDKDMIMLNLNKTKKTQLRLTDNDEQWEVLPYTRASKLNRDEIICRVIPSHSNKMGYRINVSIGLCIAEICDFNKGDRIAVLRNKLNNVCYLLRKNDIGKGYLLSHGNGANCLTFAFSVPLFENIHFILSQNVIVEFDINNDKSLFLDLSGLIKT